MLKKANLFSAAQSQNIMGKIINFPLTRILISMLFIAPVFILHKITDYYIEKLPAQTAEWLGHLESVIMIGLFILTYRIYTRVIEKREAHEFSMSGAVKEFGGGLFIGMALITIIVAILALLSYIRFSDINTPLILLSTFFMFGIFAFIEELLCRLILFRLLEELFGSWVSMILVSLLFGVAHLSNDNANIVNALAIALEAGILTAAGFMLTRRMWLVFGIHLGWNYMQSGVFGITVSGVTIKGFLVPEIVGPELLTGGEFGIEGSITAVIVCLIAGTYIAFKAVREGQIVKPIWLREKAYSNQIIND